MSDTMMTFMKYALIFCITGVVMCIGVLFGYMEGFKDCKHKEQINKHFEKWAQMTKDKFVYALMTCDCTLKDGKTYYEHNDLIRNFEELGFIENVEKKEK